MGKSWKFINGGFSLAMFDHRRVHTLYLGPIHKNWILYGTVTFQAFKLAAYWWVYTTFIGSQINGFCLDSCRIPIFVGGLSPFWLVESHPILVLHHVKAMARSRWWPTPWTTVPSRFQVCMCIYTHKYIYIYYIHICHYIHCPQSLLGLQFIHWWPWKVPNCKSCLVKLGPRDDSMILGSMRMLAYLQLRSIFPGDQMPEYWSVHVRVPFG
jgi:hypothetical protein